MTEKITIEISGLISNSIPVLVRVEHDKYDPETILCEIRLISGLRSDAVRFQDIISGDEFGNLVVRSSGEDAAELVITGVGGYRISGEKASIDKLGYEYGLSDTPITSPENIYLSVELTPSGILSKRRSRILNYDGTVEFRAGYPEEIEWDHTIGKGRALVRYAYEDRNVFDNKATVQIERPTLSYEIDVSKNLSPRDIKQIVLSEVQDICLILSLCYRKTVAWYEMDFVVISRDRGRYTVQPKIRRKVYRKTYPDREDELINHRDLINGGLYRLVSVLCSSPLAEVIRRTITFLTASESDNTVEVKYFLSVISLESFCDGFVENSPQKGRMPSGKWKTVEKSLRKTLDDLSNRSGYSPIVENVKKKLPELKSIPVSDKIIYSCKALGVSVADLWGTANFERGLLDALDMRNRLFHRAICEEPFELFRNLVRLQTLTERLLLKALEWPDDKIWRWCDQRLKRINGAQVRST